MCLRRAPENYIAALDRADLDDPRTDGGNAVLPRNIFFLFLVLMRIYKLRNIRKYVN
jgi:hypothetical protein